MLGTQKPEGTLGKPKFTITDALGRSKVLVKHTHTHTHTETQHGLAIFFKLHYIQELQTNADHKGTEEKSLSTTLKPFLILKAI